MEILVVDDEQALRVALRRALGAEGYSVTEAPDGQAALAALAERGRDLVILDVLMPGIDGLQVCARMRELRDRTPVLMLTARETVGDKVAGLEAGADDYLVKPFALVELLARVKALLRRAAPADDGLERLSYGDLLLDTSAHEVRVQDRVVELTRTEFALLRHLMSNPERVQTRAQINERVWGYDFGPTSNSLGVYVGYLRRKLEADGAPRLIQTVRGVGYVLRTPRE